LFAKPSPLNINLSSDRFSMFNKERDIFALPPGRLKLATNPSLTGSSPVPKMIGIVVVAAIAATVAPLLAGVTITDT
jgi:hypothetical protein